MMPLYHFISLRDMLHIMDSDTSQTLAIHDVRKGKTLLFKALLGQGNLRRLRMSLLLLRQMARLSYLSQKKWQLLKW
jgi:hypothetical protein